MTYRQYLLLALLGLIVLTVVAAFQSAPGYMDADYYYAGGLQLAAGHGFTEPYLWNYLDEPAGLPHPSNAYWMPLASLLAAAGSALFGPASWTGGRLGFILIAAAVPPLTAGLSWSLTARKDLSMAAGLLAVFSAFYLPFLPVTDTFGLYMVLGGLFFLLLSRSSYFSEHFSFPILAFLLGIIAGLMHLTRADGLLWLLLALVTIFLDRPSSSDVHGRIRFFLYRFLSTLAGYLLIMGPWFIRNALAFGQPLGPGGAKMLWLTTYDQIFAYPPSQLTFTAWLQSGLASILKVRFWALGVNLERTLAEQGEIFLLPLIVLGLWHLHRDRVVKIGVLAWLLTLGMMTVAFPFAGARGGFFHSGAALQPLWWTMAPLGLDRVIEWGKRKRGWNPTQAGAIFRPAVVILAALLTVSTVITKVIGASSGNEAQGATSASAQGYGWNQENAAYSQISQLLRGWGAAQDDVVMVANPPGYYLASGSSTIAVPDGDANTLLEAARRYDASYLILEPGSMPTRLAGIYKDPDGQSHLTYRGEAAGARIFLIEAP